MTHLAWTAFLQTTKTRPGDESFFCVYDNILLDNQLNWTWNKCMTWNIKESIASLYTSLYKVIYWLLMNLVPLSGLYRSWTYSSQTIFVFLSSSFVFWVIYADDSLIDASWMTSRWRQYASDILVQVQRRRRI